MLMTLKHIFKYTYYSNNNQNSSNYTDHLRALIRNPNLCELKFLNHFRASKNVTQELISLIVNSAQDFNINHLN